MEVTVEKRATSKINQYLAVEVNHIGSSYHIKIIGWHSCTTLTIDEWKEVNSVVALSLDKLGGTDG